MIRSSVSVFGEGNLSDVEVPNGTRAIDAAVGTSHAFDIAAIKLAINRSFNGLKAAF